MGLVVVGTALAAPTQKEIAAYDASKRAQLIEWIEQLRGLAAQADKKAEAAQSALVVSQKELTDATDHLAVLQGDIERLTSWGNEQQRLFHAAQAKLDALLVKYHHLKLWASVIVGGLAGLLVGLLILKWGGLALNSVPGAAIAFGGPVAAAAAAAGMVWVFF
jgi:hypothetical protein